MGWAVQNARGMLFLVALLGGCSAPSNQASQNARANERRPDEKRLPLASADDVKAAAPPAPPTPQKVCGTHVTPSPVELWCGEGGTDQHLIGLSSLADLGRLDLSASSVTDATLARVGKLASLKFLDLSYVRTTTDAGLKHLAGLGHLEELNLSNTDVTDAGLEHLRGLTNLRTLKLDGALQVSGAALKQLAGLQRLTTLDLRHQGHG